MQYFNSLCCYLHLLTLLFSFGIFSGIFIPVKERFEIEVPNSSLKNKQYYILFIYIIKDRVQNKTRTRPTINKNKNVQVGKKTSSKRIIGVMPQIFIETESQATAILVAMQCRHAVSQAKCAAPGHGSL